MLGEQLQSGVYLRPFVPGAGAAGAWPGGASALCAAGQDAYYASRKVLRPLLGRGHHLVSRVRNNAVAYYPAPPPERVRRGRRRTYGEKLPLREHWQQREQFHTTASPVYGETGVTLRYAVLDLLWRLQYLALYHHRTVWQRFGSRLRTMKPHQPPSEAVVAHTLRNTLPEFLADSPEDCIFKKFLLDHTDFERCPALLEAA